MKEEVEKAVEVLKKGGIILYPTDTVWGIGCDATNTEAAWKIYKLKGSENKAGMLVLVDTADRAVRFTDRVPDVAWQLMELADKPLTLIMPGAGGIAANVLAEDGSVGMRLADHEFCRALVRRLGRPVVSTSANFSGDAAPLHFEEISDGIKNAVDMVVNPRFEGRPTRQPSSLIKLGPGGEIEVLRK